MKYRTHLTALAVAAALALAGCSNASKDNATAGNEAEAHNSADVEFAQQMIPHHEQAIEMAKLAESRAENDKVKDLAADIEAAQGPEIKTMTGWLKAWDEEVTAPMDHGSMDDMDSMGEGMMSGQDMADLEKASGAEFDRMFLTMMIEHHEGAITMAKKEQSKGKNPDAIALATQIQSAQTDEIKLMKGLLSE